MDKEELKEPTLFEVIKKNPEMTYNEASKVLEELKLKKEAGACITAGMKRDKDAMEKMKKGREVKNEYDYHKYWKDMYEKEHKLRQEAEGEMTIVKGIGMNSPEMKALRKEVEELKADLARAKEDHQYDKLIHQKELEDLRKK